MSFTRAQGYTLIELLVVIALLAGLSSVLLINGSESRNLVRLQTAAQTLESALTQAQAFGNSGRAFPAKSDEFDSGYGVYVTTDDPSVIRIYGGFGDTNPTDGVWDEDEEKYSDPAQDFETIPLGGDVEIDNIRGLGPPAANNRVQGHVLFRRGEAEAHIYSENQTHSGLEITLASGGASVKVIVNKTGFVYVDQ